MARSTGQMIETYAGVLTGGVGTIVIILIKLLISKLKENK